MKISWGWLVLLVALLAVVGAVNTAVSPIHANAGASVDHDAVIVDSMPINLPAVRTHGDAVYFGNCSDDLFSVLDFGGVWHAAIVAQQNQPRKTSAPAVARTVHYSRSQKIKEQA